MCNRTAEAQAKAASTGNYTLQAGRWQPVLGADPQRRSALIYNDGPNAIYLTYANSAPISSAGAGDGISFKLSSGTTLEIKHGQGVWVADPVGGSIVYVENETGVGP